MNYQQTIEYLFSKLPMFSRIGPAAFKKDLTNTLKLCEALDHPQRKFKSIHVAGTNGKGSVSHMLAAILQTAGYKTGLYTSPHLKDFRERIKINGEMIGEASVSSFTKCIKPLIEELKPSFFEITVGMAFDYFAKQQVDIAVIEVGLGGRFDSTNVIIPELSIITNISYDHTSMLGNTLEKIAFEKAGIIKPGVPVVIGELHPETKPVFEQVAAEKKSGIRFASQQRYVATWKWQDHQLIVEVEDRHHHENRRRYSTDLTGIYQLRNILTVLEAAHLLHDKGWKTGNETVQIALPKVKKLTGLHGRWEIIHRHPDIILEVAHNEEGIRLMAEQIELCSYHHLHIVLGIVKDKETDKILCRLPRQATYYFTHAHIPRAMHAETLKQNASRFSLEGSVYENVNMALEAAKNRASAEDLILVCGSIFLAGEIGNQYFK